MISVQQSMREYLEVRLAQLDILFAQTDTIMEDVRILHNRPSGLIKRLYRFQRQCRFVKRDLICAEHCDSLEWDKTRLRLDQSCDHVKNLFHQLRCQVKACRKDKPERMDVSISMSTDTASSIAAVDRTSLDNELIVNNTQGEKQYAAEYPKLK